MAEYGNLDTLTLSAAADLSAVQYHIMRISNGASQVNIASLDSSTDMIGVLQNKPSAAGRSATVAYSGKSKVVAGAAVNSPVFLTCNGSGRAVAATSGDIVFGRAIETAAADGDLISVILQPTFRLAS